MKTSLVTIIIPTYNRSHLIGETLDSVVAQTYQNWECIVVDDGSTDYTEELLEFYCGIDSRISFHRRSQDRIKGANACRNYGFELSRGEYINWLDSDDLLSSKKIEKQLEIIENQKETTLVICKWGLLKDGEFNIFQKLPSYDNFASPKDFLEALYISEGYIPMHAYLIPRSIFKKVGLWNEFLTINQDAEFIIRVICQISQILFSDDCYVSYRSGRRERVSLINTENVKDYYHSWKLIDLYLKIRFKENEIKNFELIKRSVFKRIPEEFSYIFRHDEVFFQKILKEEARKRGLIGRFFRSVKKRKFWL